MEIISKPFILQIVLSGWNGHSKNIKSRYSCIILSVLIMPKICFITAMKCGGNTYENKMPPLYMLQKKTMTICKHEGYLSQARPIISY